MFLKGNEYENILNKSVEQAYHSPAYNKKFITLLAIVGSIGGFWSGYSMSIIAGA